MFGPLADRDRHEGLKGAADALFALLEGGIAALQRAGRVGAGDPGDVALSAWAMVHGVAMLALDGRVPAGTSADIERVARTATDLLMTGMAARSGAASWDNLAAAIRRVPPSTKSVDATLGVATEVHLVDHETA